MLDMQIVSYAFIYLSMGIFSKLFNSMFFQVVYWVFLSFMLTILDNVINVDVQLVSYILIY